MSGAQGPTGPTGATGRKGLQGTPYGAPGTTFYSPTGRVTTSSRAEDITAPTSEYGTTYLSTSAFSGITVTLPSVIPQSDYGAFWTFRNTYNNPKNFYFANTAGILHKGNSTTTTIQIPGDHSVTLVFSGGSNATSTYIAI